MPSYEVPVTFNGLVHVEVPDAIDPGMQEEVARRLAIAQVWATAFNPDNQEVLEQAYEQLQAEASQLGLTVTEEQLENVYVDKDVGGNWQVADLQPLTRSD